MRLSHLLYIEALFCGIGGVLLLNPILLAATVISYLLARAARHGRFGRRWD